jgi:hypothetical protein
MFGFFLPKIHCHDTSPVKPRQKLTVTGKKARDGKAKYDHWQMLMDRLDGMTWAAIGAKHGVHAEGPKRLSSVTCHIAMYSNAALKLTPAQVQRLGEIDGRQNLSDKSR